MNNLRLILSRCILAPTLADGSCLILMLRSHTFPTRNRWMGPPCRLADWTPFKMRARRRRTCSIYRVQIKEQLPITRTLLHLTVHVQVLQRRKDKWSERMSRLHVLLVTSLGPSLHSRVMRSICSTWINCIMCVYLPSNNDMYSLLLIYFRACLGAVVNLAKNIIGVSKVSFAT